MLAQIFQMPDLLQDITTGCHELFRLACDPYRPELHYMRGPGPKWHAKHGSPLALDSNQTGSGR